MEPISIPSILAVTKEQKLLGAIAYTKEEFIECLKMIEKKEIDVKKYIDDIVPLEKVQNALFIISMIALIIASSDASSDLVFMITHIIALLVLSVSAVLLIKFGRG